MLARLTQRIRHRRRDGIAKAIAAFEGRTEVTVDDIRRTISLSLRHRLRKDPLETIDSGYKVEKAFNRVFGLDGESA